jgi:hypothetical protein
MGIAETKVHSFIVKLWQENDATGKTKWHGYITHVPDGRRRYLQDLRDIISYIKSYLANDPTKASAARERFGWLKWARGKR